MYVNFHLHAQADLIPERESVTHCIKGCVCLEAGLYADVKENIPSLCYQESNPGRPVAILSYLFVLQFWKYRISNMSIPVLNSSLFSLLSSSVKYFLLDDLTSNANITNIRLTINSIVGNVKEEWRFRFHFMH